MFSTFIAGLIRCYTGNVFLLHTFNNLLVFTDERDAVGITVEIRAL